MSTRREFLKKAASTLSVIGALPVAGALASVSQTSTKPIDTILPSPKTITELVYNDPRIDAALHAIRHGNDKVKAFADIAKLAHPVINQEIDRVLDKELPYFMKASTVLGNTPTIPPIEISDAVRKEREYKGCYIPSHGNLPKAYVAMMNPHESCLKVPRGVQSVKIPHYQLGISVDWFTNTFTQGGLHATLYIALQQYVDGIINQICKDAEELVLASAYHKNIVIAKQDLASTIFQMTYGRSDYHSPPDFGIKQMTDLYVDTEVFANLKNIDTVSIQPIDEDKCYLHTNDVKCICHRTSKLDVDGEWRTSLTLPNSQGGFGMMMPLGTKHLILGLNRNTSDQYQIVKQNMEIWADNSRPEQVPDRFYGWMNIACFSMGSDYVQLGALPDLSSN